MTSQVDATAQETLLNAVLDTFYYEDGELKPLTQSSLNFINASKKSLGKANASLIEGILKEEVADGAFKFFSRAEEKGCTHPILSRCLANCFEQGDMGVPENTSTALDYYIKSISGMSPYVIFPTFLPLRLFLFTTSVLISLSGCCSFELFFLLCFFSTCCLFLLCHL